MNKIQEAFAPVTADAALKEKTAEFLHQKISARQKLFKMRMRYAAAVLVMVLMLSGGFGARFLFWIPVSYIGLDADGSVSLSLSRMDTVVAAEGYSEEDIQLLNTLNLTGKNYTEAIETLLQTPEFMSESGESALSVTVLSDKEEELVAGIQGCQGYQRNSGQCTGVDSEIWEAAQEIGMPAGKYRAYQELVSYDPTVTVEECQNMTMRELREKIAEYTGESVLGSGEHQGQGQNQGKDQGKNQGEGQGQNQGKGRQQDQGQGQGSGNGKGRGNGAER